MNYPNLENLIFIIEKLRDPKNGCPWDLEQTHSSLLPYLIEESYEFIHAVNENDSKEMENELGDILLQVLLHSTIASESSKFTLESVAKNLAEKMIRRHPHVFGDSQKRSKKAIEENWEKIKQLEKDQEKKKQQTFDSSLLHSPSLFAAHKIGKKSSKINFDWKNPKEVLKKVREELLELEEAINDQSNIEEEIGDLLFSIAQLSRHLKINSELALNKANLKFVNRFEKVECLINNDNKNLKNLSNQELEDYWKKVKLAEKENQKND